MGEAEVTSWNKSGEPATDIYILQFSKKME